jgi:hypothetical protein
MEEDVVDDTDESVKQQANGRYANPLSKGGQQRIDVVHRLPSRLAYRFIYVPSSRGSGMHTKNEMNMGS